MEMWSLTTISFLNATLLKIFGGSFVCGVIVLSLCSFLMTMRMFGVNEFDMTLECGGLAWVWR